MNLSTVVYFLAITQAGASLQKGYVSLWYEGCGSALDCMGQATCCVAKQGQTFRKICGDRQYGYVPKGAFTGFRLDCPSGANSIASVMILAINVWLFI